MLPGNTPHKVAILLCTYNGERYLDEQLNSVLNQAYNNWRIYASDDGSNDKTLKILNKFQEKVGADRIVIFNGPKNGPTDNFLSVLSLADEDCMYFAFCDQDDVWHEEKLCRAIKVLIGLDADVPAVYCSSTRYIASDGSFLQNSYIFKEKPTFENALVQSIAGGNTMVFNRMVKNILIRTPKFQTLVAHDWWLYIITTALGGHVHYDVFPSVDYRQHSNSLVGENRSFISKLTRIRKLIDGRFRDWNDHNLKALNVFRGDINDANKLTLKYFYLIKYGNIFQRLYGFLRSGIRRQTFAGNLALFIAAILKKV